MVILLTKDEIKNNIKGIITKDKMRRNL